MTRVTLDFSSTDSCNIYAKKTYAANVSVDKEETAKCCGHVKLSQGKPRSHSSHTTTAFMVSARPREHIQDHNFGSNSSYRIMIKLICGANTSCYTGKHLNTSVVSLDLKKLWCCVGGGDQDKSLVLSNELINVELPP